MTTPIPPGNAPVKILVWDFPTRVFHWSLVICFAGAMVTQEMERLRLVHETFGYTMFGLVGFRLVWGLTGTRYARFSAFMPEKMKLITYLRSLARCQPMHTTGHNPVGALAILAILALITGISVSGILLDHPVAGELFEEMHEALSNLLLVIVGVHVSGVILASIMHRENLVRAMIHGYKTGHTSQGIRSSFWWLGWILIAGMIIFWLVQFEMIRI